MRELSLNVLDIVQNSISAKADLITIDVEENTQTADFSITITDNGCGMTPEQIKSVKDPFYTTRTTRKVGMGVPLFKMAAEMSGGSFDISSTVNEGTKVVARFKTDNVDFIPLGDIASTMTTLISMNTDIDFVYRRCIDGKEFTLDTRQVRQILEDVPMNDVSVITWIKEFINENTQTLTEVQ